MAGSARQCCAHSEYGSTYRVLTGYSNQGARTRVLKRVLKAAAKRLGRLRQYSSEIGGLCSAVLCTLGVWLAALTGGGSLAMRARAATGRVLTGYAHGTDSEGTEHPATHANPFPVLVAVSVRRGGAVHGSARHPGVGLCAGTALDIGYSRGAHMVLTPGTHRVLCVGRS